jgi:hypothetical protein
MKLFNTWLAIYWEIKRRFFCGFPKAAKKRMHGFEDTKTLFRVPSGSGS